MVIVNDETATVSIRTVPDQDLDDLERKVTETLQNVLSSRGSKNTLRVQVLLCRSILVEVVLDWLSHSLLFCDRLWQRPNGGFRTRSVPVTVPQPPQFRNTGVLSPILSVKVGHCASHRFWRRYCVFPWLNSSVLDRIAGHLRVVFLLFCDKNRRWKLLLFTFRSLNPLTTRTSRCVLSLIIGDSRLFIQSPRLTVFVRFQNERLRINNLIIGVQVLRSMLCEVGNAPLSE